MVIRELINLLYNVTFNANMNTSVYLRLLKLFRNSVLCSDMSLSYNGKCDKCGKIRPDILIEVYKERGDGVLTPMIWCLECIRSA